MNVNPKERTEFIGIRVTPEEKEVLKKAAAAAGLTLTAYLLGNAIGESAGKAYIDKLSKK